MKPSDSSCQEDDEDDGAYDEEGSERDDFGVVPVNNMDHDTVHIKVMQDETEPKFYQKSQHFLLESDTEGGLHNPGYQSDVMRSLHMLGGNSAVTVKTTNRVEDFENGGQSTIINVN